MVMKSPSSLIYYLKNEGALRTTAIIQAFTKIDRKDFVPKDLQGLTYEDTPLPIGEEQTISQPYTVAFMLELLSPHKGDKVLDVGSGSGYTTALLAEIVGTSGRVIGIEIIPKLVTFGKKNLSKYNFPQAKIHQAIDVVGAPDESPFDKILVSASTNEIPKALIGQLKKGGHMIIPIGEAIWKINKKEDDNLEIKKYEGFNFVPLIV